MVDYKIVRYCRLCRKRFVIPKSESKKYYCDKCQSRMNQAEEQK